MLVQRYKILVNLRRLSNIHNQQQLQPCEINDSITQTVNNKHKSVLEDCAEDISHIAPFIKPTFNFAAYVNKSETLQQLVKLSVDLSIIEKKSELIPYILKLDFEKDIKNHVIFFSELGIENIGWFLTKNPLIFKESLENLQIRLNYLKSKRFTDEMITAIISRNPNWLSYSTQAIDDKLGFFQKEFKLLGREVRALAVQQPKLITYSISHIKLNTFVFKEEMCFREDEVKSILLKKPNLFMKLHINLLKTFEFVHKKMKIPIERIVEMPEVLSCRLFRIRQRHLFLENLGRTQYNPREPNYISLVQLVSGSDVDFCQNVAKSSVQAFNIFLKSL